MESFIQDVRYGLRTLAHSPRFTVTAILTLAIGIAATVAVFTFVNAALLRPLPYKNSNELINALETRQQAVETQFEASYPDYLDWRAQNQAFSSLAAYGANAVILKESGGSRLVPSAVVSDNFFPTLGVSPSIGRDFQPGEDQLSAPRTAILSYTWWQKYFGGNRNVIGQTVSLDDNPTTIIGVLPRDFHFAPVGDPDVWLTLHAEGELKERRNLHWLFTVGRLKPGVSRVRAAKEMNAVAERLEQQYPVSNKQLRVALVPLTETIVGQIRPILVVLLSAVALLLLIACVNVANLLLARSIARRREVSIRTALGATRFRIARQTLTEGILLSIMGGALAIALAQWLVKGLAGLIPDSRLDSMPYLKTLSLDWRVLVFAVAVAFLTGILFALAPAIHLSGAPIQDALKEGVRSSQPGAWKRVASALVVAEVAIAMVLLTGAALLGKSLFRLLRVDPGFNQSQLIGFGVGVPGANYQKDPQQIAFANSVLENVRALPGVKSAGTTSVLPVSGNNTLNTKVVGQPYPGHDYEANIREVSHDYFQTLQAQLAQGRWFTDADNETAPGRIIVNQTYANLFLHGLNPLEQQLIFTCCPKQKPYQIIGVVKDVKEGALDAPAKPAVYQPFKQSPGMFFNLVVRTERDPAAAIPEIEAAVRHVEPQVVIFQVETIEEYIQRSPAAFLHRYPAWLAGFFAAVALLLGSIGLYGLVTYSVSQRTQEIGIRIALGAQRSNVLKLILSQGVGLILPGVGFGIVASIAAASLLRSLLFGVTAWDPLVLAAVAIFLAVVTLLASYMPARQATKVDPMRALRYE